MSGLLLYIDESTKASIRKKGNIMTRMKLPTIAEFAKTISDFMYAKDAAGCEAYLCGIMRECGRPRLRGHRDDKSEMNVALFLFHAHVKLAEDALKQAKAGHIPEPCGNNKLYYDELCKWNGVDVLPNYAWWFNAALRMFPSMNLTYKTI